MTGNCSPDRFPHSSTKLLSEVVYWRLQDPRRSRLKRMVPSVGSFFTPIKLMEAFNEYDEFFALSRRRYVPPNFAEMRHVLNIAQVQSLDKLGNHAGKPF